MTQEHTSARLGGFLLQSAPTHDNWAIDPYCEAGSLNWFLITAIPSIAGAARRCDQRLARTIFRIRALSSADI